MTPQTPVIADIKLYKLFDVTYALHTYADGKQFIWAQLGTDKFQECDHIPEEATRYYPGMYEEETNVTN